MNNRFWLFAGDRYYPEGGFKDFRGSYITIEDALKSPATKADWWHILDTKHMEIVITGRKLDE